MKFFMYCLTFSTIISGYSNNGYYYLDLSFNKQHSEAFDSFNFFASNHAEIFKTLESENKQFNSLWDSREVILKQNHLYDIFCASYKKLYTEIQSIVSTLRSIEPGQLTLVRQAEILVALSKFNSVSATISHAVNATVKQVIPYWFNKSGQLINSQYPNWYNIFDQVKNWYNINEYNKIVSNLEDRLIDWHSSAGLIECADNVLYQRKVDSNNSSLCQMGDIRDLRTIDDFCKRKQFEQAYQIVQKHNPRFVKNPQDNFFQKVYSDQFNQRFDWRGIDKRYLNDPIIGTLNLTARATPSPYNAMLEKRYNAKHELLRACNVTNPSAQLEACVYDIVDDYMSHNYQGIFDKAAHIFNSFPELYSDLVDHKNGSFKFLKLNPPISNIQFPSSIHQADNADLRMLVNRLGLIDTSLPVTQSQVMQSLEYVKHALQNSDGASRYFATRITESLEKGIEDPVLHLPDFYSQLSNQNQDVIREKVAAYIADKLMNYDQCVDIFVKKAAQSYEQMIQGDTNSLKLLEKTFGQEIQENVLLIDIEQLKTRITEVNEDFNTIFDRLADAYKDVAANGLVQDEMYTPTDAATRLCLLERGINPLIYERFNGDQIQQVWHQLDVKALHVGGHLSLQAMPSGTKQILEFGLQSNFAVNAFIKAKDFGNAFNSTCSALISYNYVAGISRICDAAESGLRTAENNLIHMAKDPIGAVIDIGKGLVNVVLMVDAQARKFSEFSHNIIFNPQKAQQQLAEHKAEMSDLTHQIIETIEQKGIEGCVKDVTQFAAESVVLGGVAKAAQTASIVGLEKIKPLVKLAKNEAIVARTTAGTIEKLGNKAGSEINTLKEIEVGTKDGQFLKNDSLNLEKFQIKISSKIAESAGPKLIKEFKEYIQHNPDLKMLENITNKLKEKISDIRYGTAETRIANERIYLKAEEKAQSFYEAIRKSSADIKKIANNTGIPEQIIEKIKNHVFYDKHLLDSGLSRFSPDIDMADAWQRLIDGNFVHSDLILLQHELIESSVLSNRNITARLGHELTNEVCNWEKSLSI